MARIIVHGYLGQMGKLICQMAEYAGCEVVTGIDRMPTQGAMPFPTYTQIKDCDMPADVIIDFSVASAIPELLEYAVLNNIPAVICTTGLKSYELEIIQNASMHIPIFKSANMSMGINYLLKVIHEASGNFIDAGFDIEIIEKHHNSKIDAPSGTALMIAEAVNSAVNGKMEYTYDRSDNQHKRSPNEIGIHCIRGGTIVGEHSIIFAGLGEVLEFKHTAESKKVFAAGALRAAKYIIGKKNGLYDMNSLI